MKKLLVFLLALTILLTGGCSSKKETKYQDYAKMSASKIVKKLTLEQKAAQMVQLN